MLAVRVLVQEQDHQIALTTALGIEVQKVRDSGPKNQSYTEFETLLIDVAD
jgi:hypothetical protein